MATDRDVLTGFLAGESAACAELLTRLRPAVLFELRRHYSGLRHAFAEILDAAENRLFEWRKQTLGGEGQIDVGQSIQRLASRLAKQEADREGLYWSRIEFVKKEEDLETLGPSIWNAEERVNYRELEEVIDALPDDLGVVLMAEAQRVLAGEAPLHEQLGTTPEAARKRLERARKALRARQKEIEEEVK
jgi:hypothetical protein